jgi:hypothetical protein
VNAILFGANEAFEGYGSKYAAAYPVLEKLAPETLVILTDGRDVLVNNPISTEQYRGTAASAFLATFEQLTAAETGSVIVSAEAQCCVSALTHAQPGDYYNKDGSRKDRACASGQEGCLWNGDEHALPWEIFMRVLAIQRGVSELYDDVYLNAGLIAGRASDLLELIREANIGKDEDDQAVLTDFLYQHPHKIILDYGQKLFGNNRGGLVGMDSHACAFSKQEGQSEGRLVHSKTGTTPLFLHSPGGYMECHDSIADMLGLKTASAAARRRLKQTSRSLGCNYRTVCFGGDKWKIGNGHLIKQGFDYFNGFLSGGNDFFNYIFDGKKGTK